MRATEFLLDYRLDEFSKTDAGIHKKLKAKGYIPIGQPGVDQSAYIEPSTGLILKVFGTQPNSKTFTKDQKMFFNWAKFCMDNSTNTFLPKFFGYESFIYNNSLYLQIRTEKLQHNLKLGRAISKLGEYASIGAMDADSTINYFIKTQRDHYKIIIQTIGKENVKLLLDTLGNLYKIASKKGYLWDLHSDNIMARSNGWPVINDPWVL
jgi:hypothetical protein